MRYEQLEVSGIHASSPECKEIQPCRSLNSLSGSFFSFLFFFLSLSLFFFFFLFFFSFFLNRDLRFQNFGEKNNSNCS